MELTAHIRIEEGSYWADVPELPGFATGDTWTSCSPRLPGCAGRLRFLA